jgi:hypothetical protein
VAIGLTAISVSAPVTKATAAPALALAFWRSALGTAAAAPYLALRRPAELRDAGPGVRRDAVVAGVLLAAHFGTWMPSLKLTSVTASTALVATTPVWTVLAERIRGVQVPRSVLVGWPRTRRRAGDHRGGCRALGECPGGTSWRCSAGWPARGTSSPAERARRGLSNTAYSVAAFGTCASLMPPVCLLFGVDRRTRRAPG